jgi:hypothetical protein
MRLLPSIELLSETNDQAPLLIGTQIKAFVARCRLMHELIRSPRNLPAWFWVEVLIQLFWGYNRIDSVCRDFPLGNP